MKYSLRNFALTFLISLIIFGAIAWSVVGSLKNMSQDILTGQVVNNLEDDKSFVDKNDLNDNSQTEFKGKSFNFLAVGLDKFPPSQKYIINHVDDDIPYSTMEAIMIVRADKEKEKFIFISLPTDFIINFKGENMPLGQLTKVLNINDPDQLNLLINEITALTGLKINYHAFIDMESFVEALDNLGGISYNVPTEMKYQDPEQDLTISFKKNQKLTKASDILKMLRFVTYNSPNEASENSFNFEKAKSEALRTQLHMSFVNELFEKMLTAENIISIPIWIPDLFKSTITNFGLEIVKDNVDLIFSYKNYSHVNLVYSETYNSHITEKYSDYEPNKEQIKASVAKISTEIGKLV
ncbi:MAG: LytR family transcriptional regulator [Ruminococcaceae bacterium]|nr:LytR family transcriptional regulator [Oscillospiraceae bacterium]